MRQPVRDRAATSQAEVSAEIAAIESAYQRAGVEETQPRLDYAPYRSSVLRHPTKDLHHADPEGVELWTPCFGPSATSAPLEADLTIQHGGEPIGERMVVTGRVVDGDGRPVRRQLVEIWQANAGGRYIHQRDQHPAPIDPNFTGTRALPDRRRRQLPVHHHQAGTVSVEEPPQRVAAGAHPLLAVRNGVHPADDHPDVLPGRSAVRARPDLPGDHRPKARDRLVATYDHDVTTHEWATGYRWDIVLTGATRTPVEDPEDEHR